MCQSLSVRKQKVASRCPPPPETNAKSKGWREQGHSALDEKEEEEGFLPYPALFSKGCSSHLPQKGQYGKRKLFF